MLSVAPAAGGAAVLALVEQNLRQNGIPWLFAASASLVAWCVFGVHRRHHTATRLQTIGFALSIAGLTGAALFFVGLGVEDLLATVTGTDRVLSDNEAVTAIGTLVASLLVLVVLPAGLILLGVVTVRGRALPRWGRPLPLVLGGALLVGAAAAGATQSAAVSTLVLGACAMAAFLLGYALWVSLEEA